MKFLYVPLAAAAALGGAALGIWQSGKRGKEKMDGLQNRINVLSDHFQLLNHWLEKKVNCPIISLEEVVWSV